MFGSRKKAPSVKIPAAVLRREAERAAKKMMAAEKKKERTKVLKAKAKEKASKKVAKQKQTDSDWSVFFDAHMQQEVWGGLWIFIAIVLVSIFVSSAEFAQTLTHGIFQKVFGLGMWILPIFFIAIGVNLLRKNDTPYPPVRVFFLLLFLVAVLGITNLFLPLEESLALSRNYGGGTGFCDRVFPTRVLGRYCGMGVNVGLALGFGHDWSWDEVIVSLENERRRHHGF